LIIKHMPGSVYKVWYFIWVCSCSRLWRWRYFESCLNTNIQHTSQWRLNDCRNERLLSDMLPVDYKSHFNVRYDQHGSILRFYLCHVISRCV